VTDTAARIFREVHSEQQGRPFPDTSNHGTIRIIRAFRPLLNDGARLLVVARSSGMLANLGPTAAPVADPPMALPCPGPTRRRSGACWPAAEDSTALCTFG
jgi:hypothetical protein